MQTILGQVDGLKVGDEIVAVNPGLSPRSFVVFTKLGNIIVVTLDNAKPEVEVEHWDSRRKPSVPR